MSTINKLAILESLDAMDSVQKEMVLKYIAEMFGRERLRKTKVRRKQAMEQIRRALHANQALRMPQF